MRDNKYISIGKLNLKNPVMVASGTFGYAEEFKDFINLKKLGAIVTKTITLHPRKGNPAPRTCETPSGMLNSIGLANPGLDGFIKDKLPKLKKIGIPIIVSIAGEIKEEFMELAKGLGKEKEVGAIELNLSCPNIKYGLKTEKMFAQDKDETYKVVDAVRKTTDKTIIVKLTPNVTDIVEIALSAEGAGADAISMINTLLGMAIDIKTKKPKLGNIFGGLSGPAIKPVALRMVWEVSRVVKIPVIGMGGIMDADDAKEFLIAGAKAIAIGTANLVNPKAVEEIIDELEESKFL